jgi:Mlc titration factor MtfA (ptsG expression regulator)/RimJ/RimL family protein N-acetyltransferase
MKSCAYCGRQNQDSASHCTDCGTTEFTESAEATSTSGRLWPWGRRPSREELLERPWPAQWEKWLRANVAHYSLLTNEERMRLRGIARVLIAEKAWEGCDGLEVTDEMKLTVSAQAALLLLGMSHDYFSQVPSIVLFPRSFAVPIEPGEDPLNPTMLLGQAQTHGAVFLSWKDTLAEGRDPEGGRNLVIHEFAHQLDFLDGYVNGMPDVRGRESTLEWQDVMRAAFSNLKHEVEAGRKTFLGSYAATNPTEFFSVVSEKFFLVPGRLQAHSGELYDVLAEYYRVDPLNWFAGLPSDSHFADFLCPSCGGKFSYPRSGARFQECPKCAAAVPILEGSTAVHPITFPIETARLRLRRFQSTDCPALCEIMGDESAVGALGWTRMTPREVKRWLDNDEEIRFPQRHKHVYLAIETIAASGVVGMIELSFIDERCEQLRFQLFIKPQFRRKGYGLEAVRAILEFGFSGLALHRMVCDCEAGNAAARGTLEKAGMRMEGEGRLDRRVAGNWVSTVFFAMIVEEFVASHLR